jgi:hypothetical protein
MWVSPKQFLVLPPKDKLQAGHPGLLVMRPSGTVSMLANPHPVAHEMARDGARKVTIFGVIGVARLPNRQGQAFLLVLRRRVRVGTLTGSTVWRHDGVEIMSVSNGPADQTSPDEDLVKGFLVHVLSTPYFYFSYEADLTQTQQRLFPLLSDENVQQVGETIC